MSPIKKTPTKLLIIDFETTGVDPKIHQPLSLGYIVVDKDSLKEETRGYMEFEYDSSKYSWSITAQAIHGLKPTRESSMTLKPYSLIHGAQVISEVILKHFGRQKVIICAHNPSFDLDFLKVLLATANIQVDFDFRMIDTSSLGMAIWNTSNSNELFETVGIKRGAHNALEDANACYEVIKRARNLPQTINNTINISIKEQK